VTLRCADGAQERHESLAGTASLASRFILIEHPGPWPGKAIQAFGAEVRESLSAIEGAKVLLMRRPDRRHRPSGARRWAIAEPRAGRVAWGTWDDESDLLGVAQVSTAGAGDWGTDPVILVCTHARHDACCGIRGKPVATALADRYGEAVWTCSHVGGHRFAGNVVLPLDGTYYGRVDAASAVELIGQHESGEVAGDHLRGFSWLEPAAQVVAVEAHRRWGPASADDIVDARVDEIAPGRWGVELAGSQALPAVISAVVEARAGQPVPLSCGAEPEAATTYTIVSLDAEDG
jgi:hypothetical protein